jgi:hypothetical protein
MINVNVWSSNILEIEETSYHLKDTDDMITFLSDLISKIKYSGETICLEKVIVSGATAKAYYEEINRW